MNDPSNVINVNLSSLLSLKAELLRKQAEVNKEKAKQNSFQEYSAHKTQKSECSTKEVCSTRADKFKKNEHLKKLDKTENSTVYEHEDRALLEKSQRTLIAKSKFYDRMSKSGGKLNSDDNCLVMFNKKRQESSPSKDMFDKPLENMDSSDHEENDDDDDDDEVINSDDEWVEYTDCLGRTRKCLQKDLAENKKRDAELAASMPERLDQTKANWMLDTLKTKQKGKTSVDGNDGTTTTADGPSSVFGDDLSMMSKHEEQKVNWERKELENLEKTDIHYQDVFFDEAREHGVGYYAFSTDEEERKRQQREFEKARQKTLEEQEKQAALRKQRENIIAERVWAAKNRQRARLGLPPLDRDEIIKQSKLQEPPEETKKERKARLKAEKLAKKREEEEKEREKERQQHVRPWDYQKGGARRKPVNNNEDDNPEDWVYKPEYEPMTQEQWNEHKRAERIEEFAPPPNEMPKRTNFTSMPPPPQGYHNTTIQTNQHYDTFISYQSTKESIKTFKRRPHDGEHQDKEFSTIRGAAIPPPACLANNYNQPSQSKKTKSSHELEQSIEAGLRFLRNKCDKQSHLSKTSWTTNADY